MGEGEEERVTERREAKGGSWSASYTRAAPARARRYDSSAWASCREERRAVSKRPGRWNGSRACASCISRVMPCVSAQSSAWPPVAEAAAAVVVWLEAAAKVVVVAVAAATAMVAVVVAALEVAATKDVAKVVAAAAAAAAAAAVLRSR